jgi:hypothetical protein
MSSHYPDPKLDLKWYLQGAPVSADEKIHQRLAYGAFLHPLQAQILRWLAMHDLKR